MRMYITAWLADWLGKKSQLAEKLDGWLEKNKSASGLQNTVLTGKTELQLLQFLLAYCEINHMESEKAADYFLNK